MNKRKLVLILLVFALITCANIQPAIAYFTTFTYAKGSHPIYLRDTTRIEEQFSNMTKHVRISSDANSEPVWVRAKVFYAYQGIDEIKINEAGNPKWQEGETDDNGYVYYNYSDPLPGGGKTDELTVTIYAKSKEIINPDDGDQYNVIVTYESTPVRYDEDGNRLPADWNTKLLQYDSSGEIVPVFEDNEEGNG